MWVKWEDQDEYVIDAPGEYVDGKQLIPFGDYRFYTRIHVDSRGRLNQLAVDKDVLINYVWGPFKDIVENSPHKQGV